MAAIDAYAAPMSMVANPLPDDVEALQDEVERRRHEVHELRKALAWYQEQQRLARAKKYGTSSDTPPEQDVLFDEPEREVHRARTYAVKGHQRRKKGGGRAPLSGHLPREVRVHELSDEQCTCGCGGALHVVDTEVTEQLEQIPAKLYVIEHHRRLYAYQQSRGSEHPRRFLNGFGGCRQSDGFAGYDALARACPAITGIGCWAHARRKFTDVQKAQETHDPDSEAAWFVEHIGALYELERTLAEVTPRERQARRQAEAAPILEAIGERIEALAPRVPPKSLLGKAITYTRKK